MRPTPLGFMIATVPSRTAPRSTISMTLRKVKFCEAEIASALAKLDDATARMAALRTEVEDPDGFVRFPLGEDGRLLSLFIHDAATSSLTNLALEKKLNGLFEAGNDAMRLSRKEYWGDLQP